MYFIQQAAQAGSPGAFAHLLNAARGGDTEAMLHVGDCLYLGNGTKQDIALAMHWYMTAAQAGSGKAMLRLAEAYSSGEHIETDRNTALHWYAAAERSGDLDARFQYAELFRIGNLVPADLDMAVRWHIKAAEAGHPRSEAFLRDLAATADVPASTRALAADCLRKRTPQD